MNRLLFSLTLVVAVAFAAGIAQAQTSAQDQEKRQQILVVLENTRVDLAFNETPLSEVIDHFARQTSLNFVLDREIADDYQDEEVTVELSGLNARSALRLVLDYLELAFTVKHGVVWITTVELSYQGTSVMRVYDVRDIIMRIKSFPGEQIDLGGMSGGNGGFAFIDPDDEEGVESIELDDLVDLIPEVCLPESWDENPDANILSINGVLVIYQTPEAHAEIARLLAMLR